MTKEERAKVVQRIEQDIHYFTNMDFPVLSNKFHQDLLLINELQHELDTILATAKVTSETSDETN